MNPAAWQRAKEIFNSALDVDPDARAEYLAAACGPDAELLQRVQGLIDSYRSDFMESEAVGSAEGTDRALLSGTRLGRYEIERLLGMGGMGEVYLAADPELDRRAAIKILSSERASGPGYIERFIREARAASALNHPNICTIYEINKEHDPPFIAMEYVEGETLARVIASGRLTALAAVEIAVQTAEALAEAHDAGIVHRDIKPANIIINKRGQVKVVDFGLAKKFLSDSEDLTQQQLSHSGMIMGTVTYMSPEQARGQAVDARTDVWSLGVVLCEMLSGKPPFGGDTTGDVIASILRSEPELKCDEGRLPGDLQTVLRTALSKEKKGRYADAGRFAEALKEALASLSTSGNKEPHNETTAVLPRPEIDVPERPFWGAGWNWPIWAGRKPVYAVIMLVTLAVVVAAGWLTFGRPSAAPINSLAVMPLWNETGNADSDYLADGITESLIGRLSQIPDLAVKARSTVFRYKGKEPDIKAVGRELDVPAILIGRVSRHDDRFGLYIELVDTVSERVLWQAQYDRPESSLATIPGEIARDVAGSLRQKLSLAEESKVTRNYTENSSAYQLYLKGRYYWDKRNEENYRVAEDAYKQAVALDPNYALAYAGLADCYLFREVGLGRDVAMPKAKEFALKALELDDTLAEAHTTLAFVNANYDLDFAAGEKEFKRAIELKPDYAIAHQFYGSLLVTNGRTDEALAEMRRAVELEPFAAAVNWSLGMGLGLARRYDESIAQLQKTLQIQPNYALAEGNLTGMFIHTGRYDEAMGLVQKHLAIPERRDGALSNLAVIYARTGRTAEARKTLDSLLRERGSQNNPYNVARVFAALGEKDKAVEWLNKAVERRSFSVWFMRTDPFFDRLHGEPGYEDLMRRIFGQ
jgi:serine/threonine-protein kinase